MKKTLFMLLCVAGLAATLVSCNKEKDEPTPTPVATGENVTMGIYAYADAYDAGFYTVQMTIADQDSVVDTLKNCTKRYANSTDVQLLEMIEFAEEPFSVADTTNIYYFSCEVPVLYGKSYNVSYRVLPGTVTPTADNLPVKVINSSVFKSTSSRKSNVSLFAYTAESQAEFPWTEWLEGVTVEESFSFCLTGK